VGLEMHLEAEIELNSRDAPGGRDRAGLEAKIE
jgi:hypothetical protein